AVELVVLICCFWWIFLVFLFFFQAEDGIRDRTVTGVQTCALPISRPSSPRRRSTSRFSSCSRWPCSTPRSRAGAASRHGCDFPRSEERRVGKECRCRWAAASYKKKKAGRQDGSHARMVQSQRE